MAGREVSVEATHDDLGIWYRANPEQVESSVEESGATKEIGDALGSPAVVNVSTKSAVTSATEAAEPVHRNPGLGRPVSLDDGPLDRDKVRTRSGLGESENGGSGAATEASGRTENGHVEASGQPESGHSADVKWSCACGAHVKQSPERIGQLGDSVWREKLSSAVRKAVECGVLEKRAMTSQGRGMTSRDGRSEADGGSDATCQAENESNAEPVQLKHLDVEIDSEAEMSAGAGEGSLTGVSAAQGLETRDAARESSALAPIVLVADDSPLLPLLAAKHLSKLFGQGSSSQEKRKPGHLASENKFSEAFAENALDREASNCRDSTDSESSSTGPLELVTVAGERNADGVAAGLLNGMTGLPGERNGSEAPGVRFLAREGPAVIAGYIETRAEASGIPPAFLPERQAGKEGKLSAEDLGGKKVSTECRSLSDVDVRIS